MVLGLELRWLEPSAGEATYGTANILFAKAAEGFFSPELPVDLHHIQNHYRMKYPSLGLDTSAAYRKQDICGSINAPDWNLTQQPPSRNA